MAKCKICGRTVATAKVIHEHCLTGKLQQICDDYCKFKDLYRDETDLEENHCSTCPMGELTGV